MKKKYSATFHFEDGWWIVRLTGAQGVHSNGRTLENARARLREALSLVIGDDAYKVQIEERIELSPAASKAAEEYRLEEKALTQQSAKTERALQGAAKTLARQMGLRDAAALLGVSRSKLSALLNKKAS